MMTAPATIKQDDVRRFVAGAIKGGMDFAILELAPDGTLRLLSAAATPAAPHNPWDEDDGHTPVAPR